MAFFNFLLLFWKKKKTNSIHIHVLKLIIVKTLNYRRPPFSSTNWSTIVSIVESLRPMNWTQSPDCPTVPHTVRNYFYHPGMWSPWSRGGRNHERIVSAYSTSPYKWHICQTETLCHDIFASTQHQIYWIRRLFEIFPGDWDLSVVRVESDDISQAFWESRYLKSTSVHSTISLIFIDSLTVSSNRCNLFSALQQAAICNFTPSSSRFLPNSVINCVNSNLYLGNRWIGCTRKLFNPNLSSISFWRCLKMARFCSNICSERHRLIAYRM